MRRDKIAVVLPPLRTLAVKAIKNFFISLVGICLFIFLTYFLTIIREIGNDTNVAVNHWRFKNTTISILIRWYYWVSYCSMCNYTRVNYINPHLICLERDFRFDLFHSVGSCFISRQWRHPITHFMHSIGEKQYLVYKPL